jgi:predicted nucleic acid-binding protein
MEVACDACCIINFLAGREILQAPGSRRAPEASAPQLFVPSHVALETLYLMQPDPNEPDALVKTAIDLQPYIDAGALKICDIETDEENALFVQLAIQVDDGEAACLAIASCRGMTVATDDRPATRLAAELGVPVINTPQFVRRWAENARVSPDEVAATIDRIQRYARFILRKDADDAAWWFRHAS